MAALGWEVVAFMKSGYRVGCSLEMGYMDSETLESGAESEVSVQVSPKRWSSSPRLRQHEGQRFFITVTNSGRAPVWIQSIGFTSGDGGVLSVRADDPSLGPDLPYHLDSHQRMQWNVPVDYASSLLWTVNQSGDEACTHGSVELGNGRKITTKQGVRLGLLRELDRSE